MEGWWAGLIHSMFRPSAYSWSFCVATGQEVPISQSLGLLVQLCVALGPSDAAQLRQCKPVPPMRVGRSSVLLLKLFAPS